VSRATARQINFADLELMRQGVRLEPLLQAISDFLDEHQGIVEQVRCDLMSRTEKAGVRERSPRIDAATGPALVRSQARQELGLP
jgi:hypothetical protein